LPVFDAGGDDGLQMKDTGQLSIVTYAANTLGCIARIFTSYQDGGGVSMIRSFLIGEITPFLHGGIIPS
jgi:hypothetical protein